ncbi:MAG: hypothetical protein BGO76_08000 [Caedibacter sp. 38-128]|nr:SIMPL domain-containing protein [Holosporales bacterium]OJX03251.1 MAG: hypothetical protein BGO76_08000 [Caedibacter sp. 38-128]
MEIKKNSTLSALILGLFIAVGLSLAGFFIFKGIQSIKLAERYVTVKGLVERTVKSDRADWEIAIRLSGDNLVDLYKQISEQKTKVQEFLQKVGIEEAEIKSSSPQVNDTHARDWGGQLPPHRFIVDLSLKIVTQKVELIEETNRHLGELIKEGVAISRSDIRYQYTQFRELRPEMLAEATKNARELAQQFAADSGSRIGAIRRSNQGVFRIMSADALPTEDFDSGHNSLIKKIRVVSTIDFFLTD